MTYYIVRHDILGNHHLNRVAKGNSFYTAHLKVTVDVASKNRHDRNKNSRKQNNLQKKKASITMIAMMMGDQLTPTSPIGGMVGGFGLGVVWFASNMGTLILPNFT